MFRLSLQCIHTRKHKLLILSLIRILSPITTVSVLMVLVWIAVAWFMAVVVIIGGGGSLIVLTLGGVGLSLYLDEALDVLGDVECVFCLEALVTGKVDVSAVSVEGTWFMLFCFILISFSISCCRLFKRLFQSSSQSAPFVVYCFKEILLREFGILLFNYTLKFILEVLKGIIRFLGLLIVVYLLWCRRAAVMKFLLTLT